MACPDSRSKHHVFTVACGLNENVIEKAFVCGIVCVSKWLTKERAPPGVSGKWPPPLPFHLAPVVDGPVVAFAALAVGGPVVAVAGLAIGGSPAASSTDTIA